jgi:hypothetical protein
MKKIVLRGLLIVAVASVTLWTCFAPYTYRYRLTISAEVGGEVRSASSVIELTLTPQWIQIGDMGDYDMKLYGDAVYLDLGQERNVVATLMAGPTGALDIYPSLITRMFQLTWESYDRKTGRPLNRSESQSLSGEDIPTLVTFSDPKDPNTLSVVAPGAFPDVFGPEVRFVGAMLEPTKESVTRSIDRYLPWIADSSAELAAAKRMPAREGGEGPVSADVIFRRD